MGTLKILLLILLTPLVSCSQNNRDYFGNITDVTIPASAIVTREEHNKMGPGYAKVLEVNLDADATNRLLISIEKSHYYKNIEPILTRSGPKPLIQYGQYKGLWYRQKNGYVFFGTTLNDRDVITATFDPTKKKATFGIFAD